MIGDMGGLMGGVCTISYGDASRRYCFLFVL